MNCKELEFLAEDYELSIVPRIDMKPFNLIGREIGPFRCNVPCKVPLWVAIHFKQLQKCTIIAPTWLSEEALTKFKDDEEENQSCVEPPHLQYMVIANLLIKHASSDIDNVNEVTDLLKDLHDIRSAKLRHMTVNFAKSNAVFANVTKQTWSELQMITKPMLFQMLNEQTILRSHITEN